jgi:hypothetical protein
MQFEWDSQKSVANKEKHGIDFETAKRLWSDENRLEIHASHPVEDRWILIAKKDNKDKKDKKDKKDSKRWTAIYTLRGNTIRIISVRKSREKEVDLYDRKVICKE